MAIQSNVRTPITYQIFNKLDGFRLIPFKTATLNRGDSDAFSHPNDNGEFQLRILVVVTPVPLLTKNLYDGNVIFDNTDDIVVNNGVITQNGTILVRFR